MEYIEDNEQRTIHSPKCLLKNKIQVNFLNLTDFIQSLISCATSNLADIVMTQVSGNKEVHWAFANWLKLGCFSYWSKGKSWT